MQFYTKWFTLYIFHVYDVSHCLYEYWIGIKLANSVKSIQMFTCVVIITSAAAAARVEVNQLKTSPEYYTLAGVYGKCVL